MDAYQQKANVPKDMTLLNTYLYNSGSAKDHYIVKKAEDEWNQIYSASKMF